MLNQIENQIEKNSKIGLRERIDAKIAKAGIKIKSKLSGGNPSKS